MDLASPALPRPAGRAPVPIPVVVRGAAGGGGGGDPGAATTWELAGAARPKRLAVQPVLHLSSLFMVRDAVCAHVGAARLPLSLVAQDLATGRLVKWGDVPRPEMAIWALYPSRRLLSARVSAFLDLLREAFPEGRAEEQAGYMR